MNNMDIRTQTNNNNDNNNNREKIAIRESTDLTIFFFNLCKLCF